MKFKIFQASILPFMAVLVFSTSLLGEGQQSAGKASEIIADSGIKDISQILEESFKKALGEADAQKAAEKAKRDEEVNAKLDSFIQGWINDKQVKRQAGLKAVIKQNWKDIVPMAPPYNDFYLRDFSYAQKSKDVVTATSLISSYKAIVVVKELLYAEEEPLMAEPRSNYQYTADTDIIINLDYDKNEEKWKVIDVKERMIGLRQSWPEDIRKKVGTYFIPKK